MPKNFFIVDLKLVGIYVEIFTNHFNNCCPSIYTFLRSVTITDPSKIDGFIANAWMHVDASFFATVYFPSSLPKLLFLGPSSVYRRDSVVVRAFASQSVDLGFISQVESYQKTLKNGIHSFPAWRPANRDSVENKPASLLVVSLGKTFNGTPPSLCGRQMVGPSSLPVVVAPV